IYKISRIAGTVVDKNKDKGQVILLTPDGVVTVKVWKNQFAEMDKQITTSKMSKSDPAGCVFIMDSPDEIARKFKRAITDSDTERCIRYAPEEKPGVANLMNIYSSVTGKTYEEIEAEFEGKGYGAFKPAVGDAVIEALRPIREETERLLADKAYLKDIYTEGATRAQYTARRTLRKVAKRIGFVEKPF
ncbi:MAG: hypothetical protein J6T99_00860, partial [Oscillospiraceae bacterium]|nr:hypothetical protein [Oscillospiraceae bacterium]